MCTLPLFLFSQIEMPCPSFAWYPPFSLVLPPFFRQYSRSPSADTLIDSNRLIFPSFHLFHSVVSTVLPPFSFDFVKGTVSSSIVVIFPLMLIVAHAFPTKSQTRHYLIFCLGPPPLESGFAKYHLTLFISILFLSDAILDVRFVT